MSEALRSMRFAGRSNEQLGLVCVMAAEGMFFVGLVFVALSVRDRSLAWPPPGGAGIDPRLPVANAVLLVASSLAARLGGRAIASGDRAGLSRWYLGTLGLGTLFVSGQAIEFARLGGVAAFGEAFRGLFGAVAGLHGLHVAAGLVLLGMVVARARRGQFSPARHIAVTSTEVYWHLVTLVWLVLVVVLLAP